MGFYPTTDLAATHAFYVGMLGLTLARDQGTCHIYGVAGGGFLGFCLREAVTLPPTVVLTLVTEDVDGVYEALQKACVKIEAAPKHNAEYGIYHFYAQGPSGERVEVQRFEKKLQS
ncbi:VOC family protein [Deinococcus arenicola]|uniref:VOC family protein n=1 Tax=Deinococcus arenicola TaxID=2994950 RepID=A0ABU4DL07_9DEIO|nr:VOC family protein [Deinococcus sp. ZS9-10]MDV6373112.1 VOC family protein [Deinococcus sp. ZS9-10]